MALNLNLPFVVIIGNQRYYDGDTIICVSSVGTEFKGFLFKIGFANSIQIIKNKTLYGFRHFQVNPTRLVLIEKSFKFAVNSFYYEETTVEDEREFLLSIKQTIK